MSRNELNPQYVAAYIAANSEKLKGSIDNEKILYLVGPGNEDGRYKKTKIVKGTSLDGVGYMMKNDMFFNSWVSPSLSQVGNSNNGSLSVLTGDDISLDGKFTFKETEEGLLLTPEVRIERYSNLDLLRTEDSFRSAFQLLNLEGNLEKIVNDLFHN